MRIHRNVSILLLALLVAAAGIASAQATKPKAAAQDKENITAPGPTGGSCSATSDDGKSTCSISCATGRQAICTNTKTTTACRCGQ